LFIDPVRKVRVLTTAGPVARSIADLRLALQLIGGPDGLVAARGEDGQLAPPRREA
jgi:Asp-tRNA(Asn)/Glu-tRNA(Gln) amidotransferase A subunit family amidase